MHQFNFEMEKMMISNVSFSYPNNLVALKNNKTANEEQIFPMSGGLT